MGNRVAVVYSSKYGTTQRYAQWIAQAVDGQLLAAKAVAPRDLNQYDLVVYGGGLYAGGIAGAKLVAGLPMKKLVVFTVGLADPAATDYGAIVARSFPGERPLGVFHLRGGVDYGRLGPVHRVMMGMMRRMILKKPEGQRDGEDGQFLNTYGRKVDYTDRQAIAPMVDFVKKALM